MISPQHIIFPRTSRLEKVHTFFALTPRFLCTPTRCQGKLGRSEVGLSLSNLRGWPSKSPLSFLFVTWSTSPECRETRLSPTLELLPKGLILSFPWPPHLWAYLEILRYLYNDLHYTGNRPDILLFDVEVLKGLLGRISCSCSVAASEDGIEGLKRLSRGAV